MHLEPNVPLNLFYKKIENTCNSLIVIVKNTNIFQDVIMKTNSKNSKKKSTMMKYL